MKTSLHPELPSLLQESEVLQQKLSVTQFQKFLEASISLPFEKQEELVQKLQQEKKLLSDARKKDVKEYEENIHATVKKIKNKTEETSRKNEQEQAENLLKNI